MHQFMHTAVWLQFKHFLRQTKSHRNGRPLSASSINTYHSSIKMFLLTYLRNARPCDLVNGTIARIVALEEESGNNANFSMQQCALRHFATYLATHSIDDGVSDTCPRCLWTPRCGVQDHVCTPPTLCFGKCSKLVRAESLNASGVCAYCVTKYPILYGADSERRSRYVEYVHDHALFGRPYDPKKHDPLIRDEIIKALRWQDQRTDAAAC